MTKLNNMTQAVGGLVLLYCCCCSITATIHSFVTKPKTLPGAPAAAPAALRSADARSAPR